MIRVNLLHLVDKPTERYFPHTRATANVHSSPSPGFQIIGGDVATASARVLEYLALAEFRALDPWERDDLRLSWLTVLRASEGHPDPWRYAFWCYFGLTPEKLIPYFVARAEAHHADGFPASLLPLKYTRSWKDDFQLGMSVALPRKKPSASVPAPAERKRVA
jgi:hypothetical protein